MTGLDFTELRKKYSAINMRPMAVREGIRASPQNEAVFFIDIDNK